MNAILSRSYRVSTNLIRRHNSVSIINRNHFSSLSGKHRQAEFAQSKHLLLNQVLQNSNNDTKSETILPDYCNVPINIANRVGVNLHLQVNHPLNIIKQKIESYWQSRARDCFKGDDNKFEVFDNFSPIVSTNDNFDLLLIPTDHVSRSKSDTYYLDEETVLRTHTSAHQLALLSNHEQFLVSGDVYRRDEIDSSHYPIFHQMEGVRMFDQSVNIEDVEKDLKEGLEGMAKMLFGEHQMRWVDAYFPFTEPSFELEVFYEGEWLEVLGCGVIQKQIVSSAGRGNNPGWAFGLGLERLAMVLFGIPDIRLFWTTDPRFHDQFTSGEIVTFQPYSKYPPCLKDISFWTPDMFHTNDFNELVRNVAGDLVEKVELIDEFVHPKTNRVSNCFRITYRSMDRSLTNEEIDALQEQVREIAKQKLRVELR